MADNIVAVDVGGTFTDICVLSRESGELRVAKVPSTSDPIEGVLAGVREAEVDLDGVALFSHGTTVATNALLTRRYPPAAMVTTKGFRDVIEIRRGTRDDLWDAYSDVAPPPIPRRRRFEVAERTDYAGNVLEELDEDGARELAKLPRRDPGLGDRGAAGRTTEQFRAMLERRAVRHLEQRLNALSQGSARAPAGGRGPAPPPAGPSRGPPGPPAARRSL
jgi:Hydantoinase/oxoprolinase N-terminal region